jgi:hypothetical protein
MSKAEVPSRRMTSPVLRYGMAVVSVSIAFRSGLFSQRFTARDVEFAFSLFAVVITVWYGGTWAGVLAIVLSGLGIAYEMSSSGQFRSWQGTMTSLRAGEPRNTFANPVVVLTSSREERDMVASYKLGVNAYVVKPVGFHEFVNAIKGTWDFRGNSQ